MGVGLYNEVRPYKIPVFQNVNLELVGYFQGEYLLITNSLPISLVRRRNKVQEKKTYRNNCQLSLNWQTIQGPLFLYAKILLNLSFRALFLLQEQQNTAEIDKRARISLFPQCKLNIREQNTRIKLPQHLKPG